MPELSHRPASAADIALVHRELMAVIEASPHYNAHFKSHEKARLAKGYLRGLQAVDPHHVIVLLSDGEPGGALISRPEYGALLHYWSWVFPSHRNSRLSLYGMRVFDSHWDHNRFHKAYAYVRPENEVAMALARRYGYEQRGVLRNHLFGQDYAVVEKPYTKAIEGYDSGVGGRIARWKRQAAALVGR